MAATFSPEPQSPGLCSGRLSSSVALRRPRLGPCQRTWAWGDLRTWGEWGSGKQGRWPAPNCPVLPLQVRLEALAPSRGCVPLHCYGHCMHGMSCLFLGVGYGGIQKMPGRVLGRDSGSAMALQLHHEPAVCFSSFLVAWLCQ